MEYPAKLSALTRTGGRALTLAGPIRLLEGLAGDRAIQAPGAIYGLCEVEVR